jgi:hypothetical protein
MVLIIAGLSQRDPLPFESKRDGLGETDKNQNTDEYASWNARINEALRYPVQDSGSRDKYPRHYLTPFNRRPENIVVKAIIVPELELRNVKMQVFLAHVVEGADDPALEDAPETFTCRWMS